jgi:serine phosphatase RsbU (regulator of sigma subunit)
MSSGKVLPVDEILSELRAKIISSLRQSMAGQSLKDGMDIALCCIDKENGKLEYAGAFNPIYIVENGKLYEIKGDRMPIGIFDDSVHPFKKHTVDIKKGMIIYMFSDGFPDQFGGPDGKKLKAARFKDLILEISKEPMNIQKIKFDDALTDWFHGNEQVDDILVMGIKF